MRIFGTSTMLVLMMVVGPFTTIMGFAPHHGGYVTRPTTTTTTPTTTTTTSTFLFKEAVGRVVGRFRDKKVVEQPATVQVGQKLPEGVDVIVCGTTTTNKKEVEQDEESPKTEDTVVNVRDVLGKGKALLIGKLTK